MTVQEAIRTVLAADTSITDVVGQKIRPDQLGQADRLPAIIVEVDEDRALETLSDAAGSERFLEVAIACCSHTRSEANSIADDVQLALNGLRNTYLDPCTFQRFEYESEPADDGSDEKEWFLTIAKFDVFFRG